MLKIFLAALLAIASASPALASSTGGDIASVTSASPCLNVATAGVSAVATLTPQSNIIDETGSNYTVATADACKTVKIGVSSGSLTLSVPAAGTFPTNWGPAVYQNTGSITASVNAASGGFDGAGGASSFSLPANAWAVLSPESSGNWDALVTSPTITTAGPTIAASGTLAGSGCNGTPSSSCTGTITSTTAGQLLAVGIASCSQAGSCSTGGSSYTISSVSDGGDTCTLASGTASTSTNARSTQFWNCPNVAAGRTALTVTWSTSVQNPNVYWAEVNGAATTAAVEAGASNFVSAASITCTSGTTTVANDLLLVMDFDTGGVTISPGSWGNVITDIMWSEVGSSLTTYSATMSLGSAVPFTCSIEAIKPS